MKVECAATLPSPTLRSPRLFVKAREFTDFFLVDTGSDVSALPRNCATNFDPTHAFDLFAINGSSITTYGAKDTTIDLGLTRNFRWNFTIAEIKQPVLGADFLEYYNLLPDLTNKRLIDGKTLCSVLGELRHTAQPSISSIQKSTVQDERLLRLLETYSSITKPPQYKDDVQHDVVCYIETSGMPIFEKPRRLRPDAEIEVKGEYREQLKTGLVRISKSQWASGLIVQRKKKKKFD